MHPTDVIIVPYIGLVPHTKGSCEMFRLFVEYLFHYKCWCAGLRPPTICAKSERFVALSKELD
jgi:hypothetical protein